MCLSQPPGVYSALFYAIETRRAELSVPMDALCEIAGTADRSYSKALRPCTVSGRLATWPVVDAYIHALYGPNFAIDIRPAADAPSVPVGLWRKVYERRTERVDVLAAKRLASRGWIVRQPDSGEASV